MAPNEVNWYFGRIHFKHQLSSLDQYTGDDLPSREELVKKLLWEYISQDGVIYDESDKIKWYFGDTRDLGSWLLGKFGKQYPENPTDYDEEVGDFIEYDEEDTQASYSMFLVYPEKNYIIYSQRKRVGFQQFREAFIRGYNDFTGIDDSMSLNLMQNETDVQQIIENAKVNEAEFEIVPTNPTTDPNMEKLDAHVQDMNASELRIEADGAGSLNMDQDLIAGGLAMSNNGYGEYKIAYEENGKQNILISEDRPAVKRMEQPDNLSALEQHAEELIEYADNLTSPD